MVYLVPARGDIIVNGSPILTREGAAVRDEKHLEIEAPERLRKFADRCSLVSIDMLSLTVC
jgi:hypothetical protein